MDWLEVRIETNHAGLEEVEAFLSAQGVDDVVIDDETEFQEFLEENRQCWDYVDEALQRKMAGKSQVRFYLRADAQGFSRLAQLRLALEEFRARHSGCGTLLMFLDNLRQEDWENSWRQYYQPMPIGQRLLVVPQWLAEEASVADSPRVKLVLDPGLTFGTGSHATTQLCLTFLEQQVRPGMRVLDLGCGSGILSIAALKLGAAQAVAADIEPTCSKVAYENAALNGIGEDRYTVLVGDILTDAALQGRIGGGYDLVVANIVADVILSLAGSVRSLLAPEGRFLCSGIIDDRADEVAAGLRQAGLTILDRRSRQGWFAFLCQ